MKDLSPEELIRAGAHFGHETSRWNPKMEPYIFGSQNRIHIIDIRKTIRSLLVASEYLRKITAQGKKVLLVGTKFQAKEIVRRKGKELNIPYVADRWLGGTLTNFQTIRSRLDRLEEIEQWEENGRLELYSKKEQASILREKRKLIRNLGGIRDLDELPGAVIVIDPFKENIAVSEANNCDIPIISLIDTDGNPDKVEVPIPCNDEAMRVILLMVDYLANAIQEGLEQRKQMQAMEAKKGDQQQEPQDQQIDTTPEEPEQESDSESSDEEAQEDEESEEAQEKTTATT